MVSEPTTQCAVCGREFPIAEMKHDGPGIYLCNQVCVHLRLSDGGVLAVSKAFREGSLAQRVIDAPTRDDLYALVSRDALQDYLRKEGWTETEQGCWSENFILWERGASFTGVPLPEWADTTGIAYTLSDLAKMGRAQGTPVNSLERVVYAILKSDVSD